MTSPYQAKAPKKRLNVEVDEDTFNKYARGPINTSYKKSKFMSLKMTVKEEAERATIAATQTALTEVLLPQKTGYIESEELPVYKLKQKDIADAVDLNTIRNQFDLQLHNFGPYNVNYSRNGRYVAINSYF